MIYHANEGCEVKPQVAEVFTALHSSREFQLNRIEEIEKKMLNEPQVEVPLHHAFAPNVYLRQVTMPKGTVVIGHQHKTEHFNIVMSGKATVFIDGKLEEIVAPSIFKSSANVRKILFIHETMIWATVHPTDETDINKLEDELIVKSQSFQEYQIDVAKANKLMNSQNGGNK